MVRHGRCRAMLRRKCAPLTRPWPLVGACVPRPAEEAQRHHQSSKLLNRLHLFKQATKVGTLTQSLHVQLELCLQHMQATSMLEGLLILGAHFDSKKLAPLDSW